MILSISVKECKSFCRIVNFLSSFLKDLRKHLIPKRKIQKKVDMYGRIPNGFQSYQRATDHATGIMHADSL